MKMNLLYRTGFAALLMLFITSCKKDIRNIAAEENVSTDVSEIASKAKKNNADENSLKDLLKDLKKSTARFHSTTQALKSGYQSTPHCVPNMGFHWANPALIDPVFELEKPEVILYAPGPGGNLKIVGVEYVVIDVGQPTPMFGDHPFDVGGTPVPAPHWSLHVWLYETNPSGLFAPFNPNVNCQ